MDNRVFNVNGSETLMLTKALELVFLQEGGERTTCKGWRQEKEHGLILCWTGNADIIPFPAPLTASECVPFVESWLKSDFAKTVKLGEWCGDCDHDGHNSKGWQVYCEGWGHVGNERYSICAIKPSFMWHGK